MRINRFLASTLFTGLFVTAALSPALGQEKSLTPQGAWSISKVDRSAQGGNSYCTLSRKYDDGVVVSLGRSQTEEYSLAIDFQKPTFAKDKALKINLQPGPGQIRAYDMMPTSEKAVVIRLGWDTGFFDALNSSQQMKVKIADQNYAFAMPEIAKGQGDLADCMEGLKAAAGKSAAPTKDVLAAEAGASSKEFEAAKVEEGAKSAGAINAQKQKVADAEKGILKNFADNIKAQEPELNNDDAAPRRNFAKADKTEDKAAQNEKIAEKTPVPRPPEPEKAAAKPAEITAVSKPKEAEPELVRRPPPAPVVHSEKSEEHAATKMAATAPSAADAKASIEIKTMEQNIADLKAENATLKQKASAPSQETQKQIDALQAEKKMLQDQIASLKAGSDKKATEEISALQAKANELEIKNQQLEDSLRQSQTRIAETAINTESKSLKQIVDLQAKLEAAQKDNTTLAKQLESLKLRQEDTGLAAVAGDWDLEQATKRYNEAEREIRRLGMQLEQERMSCNREKAEIEQMLFDPAVAEQKQIEKLSQLQKDLTAAQAKIADNAKLVQGEVDRQLAAKTQSIETEKVALSQQVSTLQKSLADKDAALAAEKAGLQNQVATLQKSLADKDASVAAEKTSLQNQLASLQKSLAEKNSAVSTEKAGLQNQIAALQKSLADKDAALFAEKTALQNQVANLQKSVSEKNDAVSTEKASLQNQVAALQKSLADKDAALAAEKASLQSQIAALQKDVAAKDSGASQEKIALQAQIDSMKNALTQKDQELAGLKAQPKIDPAVADQRVAQEVGKARAVADQEIIGLKTQNQAMTQSMESMKLALAAKDKALADAQAAPKIDPVMTKQVSDLQANLAEYKKNNDLLRDQNTVLRQDSEKLRLQLADIQTSGATRADQVASLQLALDGMKREMEMKDRASATYQNQLASIQQDNAQLKARLAVADTDRSNSSNEVGDLTRQIQSLQKQVNDLQRQKATPVNMDRSASSMSTIGRRYDSITPAAGYVSSAAAPVVPVVAQAVAAAPVGGAGMGGYDRSSVQSLLQKSGLSVNGVQAASGFSGADNFAWTDSSNVKGLASIKMSSGDFDKMVNDYIAYQKGQCGGDFASMPSPSNSGAAKRMALYEVACVSPSSQSTSSSLVFFEDQGRFIAIANQIDAANMDIAMDSRDKIASLVRGL
jgi:chromosome segregation ATPase